MDDPEIAAIDAAMKAKGHSRADLGRLLGLDSSQVSRIFGGTRRLQLHEARKVREWLGGEAITRTASGMVLPMPGMVPLYGWVGAASGDRLTIAEQNLRGYVPMHPNQAHVRDAFALEVQDVSMEPRYEAGEIVYLAPNRWPRPNSDGVFVTTEQEGLLKRLVRRGQGDEPIVLRQLNPEKEIEISPGSLAQVHAVVGRG
jgi:SOS-response transcriptional repressor LexA